ncbi:saccharopine dehydrogenase family protein [Calditerrivibrio nitroreducens]|uniref:Carboxynorspermidine dehydrogenase n=1 Tax=Calditerrivibrio nitroreducens (strain DSM 19672 / NBRC 101217 / Yu37-1) TaxID=768670 RepID=E4THA3_CALNY|nr:saccharopine dehydrogenase family protein [Calditerrivibrio nitroreducens]ADR18797.1 carboxynorspermidine dehydrogenase [Calditerrivibrio nitroreducens DSM 19672]
MAKVLIIGAGGVGNVVAKKCAMNSDVFTDILLASRTIEKCNKIRDEIKKYIGVDIQTAQVDADNVSELVSLFNKFKPDVVINVALPYQDLTIMDACLEAGVNYLDTANYEPKDTAKFEYKWQWAYQDKFKEAGLMAVLGCGFDPGVTGVFTAYALKHIYDEIYQIDILDCNAGNHGYPFATNFNPEINIREVTQVVRHWDNGKWVETPPIIEEGSVHFTFNYPQIGPRESYLLYHEELESLAKNVKGIKKIRFWMTFSENYLTHLKVLRNVGMTRIDEVDYKGCKVVPMEFLRYLLPDPASLAERYTGLTNIGNIFDGVKDGKRFKKYIYNVCDHAECYKEVQSQAISYTTGVPAMIGAMMMVKGIWAKPGVYNVEELDPDEFMNQLNKQGLPWVVEDFNGELPE